MREIRCVFFTTRLVNARRVSKESFMYYRDDKSIIFDILHDYIKIFWSLRNTIFFIDFNIHIDGCSNSKMEAHVKGMIDSTLSQCDGSIPQTGLQMSLIIDKIKQIRDAAIKSDRGLKGSEEQS